MTLDRDTQHVIGVLRGDWPRCPYCKRYYEEYRLESYASKSGGYCNFTPGACPQCTIERLRDMLPSDVMEHFVAQLEDIIARG